MLSIITCHPAMADQDLQHQQQLLQQLLILFVIVTNSWPIRQLLIYPLTQSAIHVFLLHKHWNIGFGNVRHHCTLLIIFSSNGHQVSSVTAFCLMCITNYWPHSTVWLATESFLLPLLVYGKVCKTMWLLHAMASLAIFQSRLNCTFSPFSSPVPDCTVPVHWRHVI